MNLEHIKQMTKLEERAEKAEAEVERLQKECQRWVELRIQHNEQYHECVLRAEKAEAELMKRDSELGTCRDEKQAIAKELISSNINCVDLQARVKEKEK